MVSAGDASAEEFHGQALAVARARESALFILLRARDNGTARQLLAFSSLFIYRSCAGQQAQLRPCIPGTGTETGPYTGDACKHWNAPKF